MCTFNENSSSFKEYNYYQYDMASYYKQITSWSYVTDFPKGIVFSRSEILQKIIV